MTAPPHVLLLDTREGTRSGRFAAVARQLTAAGMTVTLDNEAASDVAFVCGRGRAGDTASLRESYATAHRYARVGFDAIVAPLRGGLAHGLLMARASGDLAGMPRVALWCDAPSRTLALRGDSAPVDVSPLVRDGLERATLRLCDLLLCPHPAAYTRVAALGEPLPAWREARLPPMGPPASARGGSRAMREVVFVGPLTRANGALVFMDAIEILAARGMLAERTVTFLGPVLHETHGIGHRLLGMRAAGWPFRFGLRESDGMSEALAYLCAGERLAIFAAEDEDDDRVLRATAAAGVPFVATSAYDLTRDTDACRRDGSSFAHAIGLALSSGVTTQAPAPIETDWAALVLGILKEQQRTCLATGPVSVSVCIVHKDRTDYLRRAIDSVAPTTAQTPADIVIVDNGSTTPVQTTDLDSGPVALDVFRLDESIPQTSAANLAVERARGDVVVFLDDDNTFATRGIARFARAMQSGHFDIVVSTLDLVDGDPAADPSSGHFIFMGDAASAGLFFNGFGDTAFAIRREAFLRLGGFTDPGHSSLSLDWVFLAKARAAGLRIGVLIEPAVRYARRLEVHDAYWRKQDLQGARRAVLEAYGDAVDAPLVARFAQGMHLAWA